MLIQFHFLHKLLSVHPYIFIRHFPFRLHRSISFQIHFFDNILGICTDNRLFFPDCGYNLRLFTHCTAPLLYLHYPGFPGIKLFFQLHVGIKAQGIHPHRDNKKKTDTFYKFHGNLSFVNSISQILSVYLFFFL